MNEKTSQSEAIESTQPTPLSLPLPLSKTEELPKEDNTTAAGAEDLEIKDEELVKKLKTVFRTVTASSFYYKTILSKKTFENLVKLQNYESTLNCKRHNCLHEVNDINNYLLRSVDKKELETIINKAPSISTSPYSNLSSYDEQQQQHEYYNNVVVKPKPSEYEIKSNPYYTNTSSLHDFTYPQAHTHIVHTQRRTSELNGSVANSGSINASSSSRSSNSFNSSLTSYKHVVDKELSNAAPVSTVMMIHKSGNKSNVMDDDYYNNNETTATQQTNLSSTYENNNNNNLRVKSKKNHHHLSLLNLSANKRISPLTTARGAGVGQGINNAHRTSTQFSSNEELGINANSCQRNHVRRNAICNPFHIPLSEGTRQLYEHNLHSSEANLGLHLRDDYGDASNGGGGKVVAFLRKFFECFKTNKVEHYDNNNGEQRNTSSVGQ